MFLLHFSVVCASQSAESHASNIQQPNTSSNNRGSGWTAQTTKFLLAVYSEHKDVPQTKKKMWDKIYKEMPFDRDQVENRFKTLWAAYKKHKNANQTSGMNRGKFEYESEMDAIFGKNHDINPKSVMWSMIDKKVNETDNLEEIGETQSRTKYPETQKEMQDTK